MNNFTQNSPDYINHIISDYSQGKMRYTIYYYIFSFVLGYFVRHFLAISRNRRTEFINAADKFRAIINKEIVALSKYSATDATIADDIMDTHHTAYLNFLPYLRFWQRWLFTKKWNEYYEKYRRKGQGQSHPTGKKTEIIKHLNSLLKFTKPIIF